MQGSDPEHHHAIGGLHEVPFVAAMLACSEAKVRRCTGRRAGWK
jgi:hypothetical protein